MLLQLVEAVREFWLQGHGSRDKNEKSKKKEEG
jgi:hypothetical protein